MRSFSLAIGGLCLAASSSLAQGTDGKMAETLIEKVAPSIVTLRVVLKLEFAGQTREHRLEGRGVIAAKSGMILADIQVVEPNVNVRDNRGKQLDVKVSTDSIKVVIENEVEERDAILVAKDSKLGFAFIKLKDGLGDAHKDHFVDFATAKDVAIGERTLTISRLAKDYDYAVFFNAAIIVGQLKKPRKAWITSSNQPSGLPVYNTKGELVGVLARVPTSLDEAKPGTGQAVVLRGSIAAAAIQSAEKQAAELTTEPAGKDGDPGK